MLEYPRTKFDFIFSLGENCACSKYLREYRLQNFSYPFDWLRNPGFEERIDLLLNHFDHFCEKEDFVLLPENAEQKSSKRLYYYNRRNHFHFIHDFKKNPGFEAMYPEVREKYSRRIERFYRKIDEAESILVVWFNQHDQLTEAVLQSSSEKLRQAFPGKSWYFLIVENDSSVPDLYEKHLGENIVICRYAMKNDEISGEELKKMQGDPVKAEMIFRLLRLKRSLWENISYFLLRQAIRLHPVKKTRKLLKKKYALKLFYAGIQLVMELDIDPEVFF